VVSCYTFHNSLVLAHSLARWYLKNMNQSVLTTFILGLLVGIMLSLTIAAAPKSPTHHSTELEQRQILLDSKMHLIEMKFDVATEHKDLTELQSDYDHMMMVLEQSHEYTGEGITARNEALRAAGNELGEALSTGGENILTSIENFIDTIEQYLHTHPTTTEDVTSN
jgi:ElaB/YqjD/DUF883 family membrane-anchored ribosome-binding protein